MMCSFLLYFSVKRKDILQAILSKHLWVSVRTLIIFWMVLVRWQHIKPRHFTCCARHWHAGQVTIIISSCLPACNLKTFIYFNQSDFWTSCICIFTIVTLVSSPSFYMVWATQTAPFTHLSSFPLVYVYC